MLWSTATVGALDDAVAAARAGSPTVLGVVGAAGYGKSTLLRAAVTRLDGFHVLRAYGEQAAQDDRFQLIEQWHAQTRPRHVMQAARLLTDVIDRAQLTGPVALVVDDLQWVDPESVETLTALVERADGDRLLVLAAYRPLGRRHPTWRRLGPPTISLDGLDADPAAALVQAITPQAPTGLAEALRLHTGGSPLHMRALLQEHPAQDLMALAAHGELPAPADLVAAVDARLAELAPDAARLLHSLAVLGDNWSDVATAAAVGAVTEADTAIDVLLGEDLIRVDRSAAARIRIAHAVLRTAAYQAIPTDTRRGLHRAAAARLPGHGERLRHRLAAALGPDEGLAADVERHADDRHRQLLFNEAARFRRLAAAVSATAIERERRLLDADIETLLATRLQDVSITDIDESSTAHARLVHGMKLSLSTQWRRAVEVLDQVDLAALDPVNTYRALVMHAWTTYASGRAPTAALSLLQAAADAPIKDDIFLGLFLLTTGQVRYAAIGKDEPLWGFDELLTADRVTLASTPDGLHKLSWRGSVHTIAGSTTQAIDDLTVVIQQLHTGALDLSDGILHAYLALAQWANGQWRRASINLDLAQTFDLGVTHPTVLAIAPLAAVVTGEDPRPSLARSRAARLAGPLPAAMYTGDITEIATLAYTGTPAEKRGWLHQRTADFGRPDPNAHNRPSTLWLLAMGLGSAWAGDADATDSWADALAERRPQTLWRPNAANWLHALAERVRGNPDPLGDVAAEGLPGLDSFAALLWVDAAHTHPDLTGHAGTALEHLGAGRYTPNLLPHTAAPHDPLAALSDRERDVTALLLEGLSYLQISRELHVTRSTVAFHLSNAYAKTNTTSRHELTQLVRHSAN